MPRKGLVLSPGPHQLDRVDGPLGPCWCSDWRRGTPLPSLWICPLEAGIRMPFQIPGTFPNRCSWSSPSPTELLIGPVLGPSGSRGLIPATPGLGWGGGLEFHCHRSWNKGLRCHLPPPPATTQAAPPTAQPPVGPHRGGGSESLGTKGWPPQRYPAEDVALSMWPQDPWVGGCSGGFSAAGSPGCSLGGSDGLRGLLPGCEGLKGGMGQDGETRVRKDWEWGRVRGEFWRRVGPGVCGGGGGTLG